MNKSELKLQLLTLLNNIQTIGFEVIDENEIESIEELISSVVIPVCESALEEGDHIQTSPVGKVNLDEVLFELEEGTYAPLFTAEPKIYDED